MKIRLANQTDIDDVLAWRNDPLSRSMFRSKGLVALEEHRKWFLASLAEPSRVLYIGLEGEQKIGICRFDYDNAADSAEVSINMNPQERGKGYAVPFLRKAIEAYARESDCELIAQIFKENLVSRKVFERCGFEFVDDDGTLLHYQRKAFV